MKKQKSHAFGKDIYLLGKDRNGDLCWLEAPSWDCGWYWGFGYVEIYTWQKRPDLSKDITCHIHIDGILDKHKSLNLYFSDTTFTKKEGDRLDYLFTEFYQLKEQASRTHKIAPEIAKEVNEVKIPFITDEIIKILTPKY